MKLLYLLGIGPVFSNACFAGRETTLISFDFLKNEMRHLRNNAGIYHNQEVIQLLRLLYLQTGRPGFELKSLDLTTETSAFLDRYYDISWV